VKWVDNRNRNKATYGTETTKLLNQVSIFKKFCELNICSRIVRKKTSLNVYYDFNKLLCNVVIIGDLWRSSISRTGTKVENTHFSRHFFSRWRT